MLLVGAGIGQVASRIVASMNDVTVPWASRTLIAYGISALIAATVAYSLSAITRSDAFAMVGTLALFIMFEPLLSAIPKVGDYTIGSADDAFVQWVAGSPSEGVATLSPAAATLTLAVWLTVFVAAAAALFARRDA